MARFKVDIPEPVSNIVALYASVMALREAVQRFLGLRGQPEDAVVTYADLITLGIITPDQVPKNGGPPRV